jgi:hypothetical protein
MAEDNAAMDEAGAVMDRLVREDRVTALEKLEPVLKANPKFRNVERFESWIRVTLPSGFNGVFLVATRGENPSRSGTSVGRSPVPGTVPVSGRALFVASFGGDPNFKEYARELAPMVSPTGYRVKPKILLGTLEDYMTLDEEEIGLLYIDSHGFWLPDFKNNTVFYYLATHWMDYEKEGKPYLEELYRTATRPDFAMLRANLWYPPEGEVANVKAVGLGSGWLRKRLKFSKDSLAFMNTCYGALAQPALLDAGATVAAGWTAAVMDADANNAASRFFNLMAKEDGPRVTWQEAKTTLENEKLVQSKVPYMGSAKFTFRSKTESVAHLLPEISSVSTDATKDQIILNGAFGTDRGQVFSTDSTPARELSVVSWSRTRVVALRGGSVPGVFMVSAGGLKSNQILLQGWKLAAFDGGKFMASGTLTLSVGPTPREEDLRVLVTNNYGPTPALRDPLLLKPVLTSDDRYLVLKIAGAGGRIDPLGIYLHVNGRPVAFPQPGTYYSPDTNEFRITDIAEFR